jgi:histidinol phosphatase-like PHP family hydrolase
MIDLHVHSIFSDGELIPSEIARRMTAKGNEGFAITDHVDFTNMQNVLKNLNRIQEFRDDYELGILIGVELTHIPPKLIGRAVEIAWREGAEIVVVHGETIAEPVKEGTNSAALDEEINILAHPGIIRNEDAEKAAENGIYLEISARRGHSLTNGYVAKIAEKFGCELVINTDAHSPEDIIDTEFASKILMGAGVKEWEEVIKNGFKIFKKLRK